MSKKNAKPKRKVVSKQITFNWLSDNGKTINLGTPHNVSTKKGRWTGGVCNLKFETNPSMVGFNKVFSLYLFPEDIEKLTLRIWEAYLENEPVRASEDFKRIFKKIRSLTKQPSK